MKKILPWLPLLIGLASWLLIPLFVWGERLIAGSGCMTGLYGMAIGFSIAVILHVLTPLALIVLIVVQKLTSSAIRLPTLLGLVYYGLTAIVFSCIVNPFILWEDYVVEAFRFVLGGFTV